MALPTPLSTASAPTRVRPPGRVGVLVLTAFALAGLATLTGHAAGVALLGVATIALGAAAALTLHAHWVAAAPAGLPAAVLPAVPAAPTPAGNALTGELRRLHAAHVEKVNTALDEGREDLARELADSYTDEALALLVRSA